MSDQSIAAELADLKHDLAVLKAMLAHIGVLTPARHHIGTEIELLPSAAADIMLKALQDIAALQRRQDGTRAAA